MSVTMDWAGHAGAAPRHYEEFLVPTVFAPFAEDLVEEAGAAPGMTVLDLACGTGALSRIAARRVGGAGRVVGVDVSAGMLAVARAQPAQADAAPIDYLEGGAEAPPVSEREFDLAFCQQGLQFFADPVAALRATALAVAPGARVALATWTAPEQAVAFTAFAEGLELFVGWEAGARMRQPFALGDPDELRDIAEAAGLQEVEVSQHTRTVSFGRPDGFAHRLALATPLAETFADAPPERQASILAHVTAAVSEACRRDGEICFPMSTNVALAVAS